MSELRIEHGARVELMSRPEAPPPARAPAERGYAHLAFALGSRGAVDTMVARLEGQGVEVLGRPRVTGDGYYEAGRVGLRLDTRSVDWRAVQDRSRVRRPR